MSQPESVIQILSRYKTMIGVSTVVLGLWLFSGLLLEQAGRFLVYERQPQHADVAIVLSGGGASRLLPAIALYQQNRISKIIVTGDGTFIKPESVYMKEFLVAKGVPSENIWVEDKATSTDENATFTVPLVQRLHAKKVVIVTSAFHSRRSYSIFKKRYPNDVDLYSVFAKDKIDYSRWWQVPDMREEVLIEWAKTILYFFR